MRHDCLGDDGIGDGAKAWKLLQNRFQIVETPRVVTCVAVLARLQLDDSEDLDSLIIRGQVCSQGYKKQGKKSQRPWSTPWSSMVCQWGMKFSLYGNAKIGNELHRVEEKAAEPPWVHSTEAQGTKWFSGTGNEAWLQEETQERKLLCVWDPWTLCQGLQEERDNTMQQVRWERSPRQGFQETKRWRQTWVSGKGSNIDFIRRGTLGSF